MNKNIRRIILIINIVIIIAILSYLTYSLVKYKYNSPIEQHIVDFKGYQFKIGNDLMIESKYDNILISQDNDSWGATITIMNDPNNVVFSNPNRMNEILRFKGFDISDGVVHTLNNEKYITFERKMSDESLVSYLLFGFYKPNDNQICEIMLSDSVNRFNYDAFAKVVKVLHDAEYDSEKDSQYDYATLTLKGTLKELYGEEETEENIEQ